jgi:hypothetical protein
MLGISIPSAANRRDEWADTIFAAIQALRAVMADPDSPRELVVAVAREILALEMTRMRHGREVCGIDGACDDTQRQVPWMANASLSADRPPIPVPPDLERGEVPALIQSLQAQGHHPAEIVCAITAVLAQQAHDTKPNAPWPVNPPGQTADFPHQPFQPSAANEHRDLSPLLRWLSFHSPAFTAPTRPPCSRASPPYP